MLYRIAGIDVHEKILAVVVSDVEVEGEYRFERRLFGSNPSQLQPLAEWLLEQIDQLRRKIFVEGELHAFSISSLRSRSAANAQTRTDILFRQIRKLPQDVLVRHAAGEIFQYVIDGDAQSGDAGLSASFAPGSMVMMPE